MTQFPHMTLNDLKTGMVVTRRDGVELIVFRNCEIGGYIERDFIISVNGYNWDLLKHYNYDLTNNHGHTNLDIVKVEEATSPRGSMVNNCNRKVLWKETPAVKLTVAEIEARLGYKIEIVSEEE